MAAQSLVLQTTITNLEGEQEMMKLIRINMIISMEMDNTTMINMIRMKKWKDRDTENMMITRMNHLLTGKFYKILMI